ncbi:hypothetical protein PHMEG_00016085 [Phytophthora megakarya]|uniref:DDE Tnp4 domain-containing protein n=1 Tax=Phytophthora megakarya TaxID=4795 RepID=A0A225W179_9STRA|nr:hypothetical protein PHMEG_00016085 [Phytophthora megakarya]
MHIVKQTPSGRRRRKVIANVPLTRSAFRFFLFDSAPVPDDATSIPTPVPAGFTSRHHYYDQALGAIDGTYFRIEVASDDIICFRNHKRFITTNVLIFCDWHMKVRFVYADAEGSVHDATVFNGANCWGESPKTSTS